MTNNMPMPSIQLRQAVSADLDFAFHVTEAAMRTYAEQTWGVWDSVQMQQGFRASFKPEGHRLIWVGGEPVGILCCEQHASHIQLEGLFLLPEFQNHGIGSQVLRSVLAGAASHAKPVHLRVLAVNTLAQRFYARHGFSVSGATAERVFMEHCA
jgi:GNAT superfamily N-acetyltransferase